MLVQVDEAAGVARAARADMASAARVAMPSALRPMMRRSTRRASPMRTTRPRQAAVDRLPRRPIMGATVWLKWRTILVPVTDFVRRWGALLIRNGPLRRFAPPPPDRGRATVALAGRLGVRAVAALC